MGGHGERSRAYIFTLNNYTEEEVEETKALECEYLVFGYEVGDEGTPHLQGYIRFKNATAFSTMKKMMPRAHLEAALTTDFAIAYCQKDGDIFEKGKRPSSPREAGAMEKKRYKRAWESAKEGRFDDIPEDIKIRHYNTLKKIRSDHQPAPTTINELDFYWFWGPSGSGKSKKARDENPGAYIKMLNKWWEGYQGEDTVIIEEWCPDMEDKMAHLIKTWADHYPFRAEIKGSSVMIRPKKIIVTSNWSIDQCFVRQQNYQPMRRRFKEVEFHLD